MAFGHVFAGSAILVSFLILFNGFCHYDVYPNRRSAALDFHFTGTSGIVFSNGANCCQWNFLSPLHRTRHFGFRLAQRHGFLLSRISHHPNSSPLLISLVWLSVVTSASILVLKAAIIFHRASAIACVLAHRMLIAVETSRI